MTPFKTRYDITMHGGTLADHLRANEDLHALLMAHADVMAEQGITVQVLTGIPDDEAEDD